MTIPEPSYISVAEAKANTLVTGLSSLGNEDVKKLIQRAEAQIDKHVRRQQHHPDDENTDRVFPRLEDDDCGTPVIPLDVALACLAQVEHLYREWWAVDKTKAVPVQKDVTGESIGGDGSYSADYAHEGSFRTENLLCDDAKSYLDGYVNRFVPLSVTDPDDVPPPT